MLENNLVPKKDADPEETVVVIVENTNEVVEKA